MTLYQISRQGDTEQRIGAQSQNTDRFAMSVGSDCMSRCLITMIAWRQIGLQKTPRKDREVKCCNSQ